MRGLDDTDRAILQLLLEDGRRPFSELAETVDLSAPAVSDRVDRLREMGVIDGFTIEVDRSVLRSGTTALVSLQASPGAGEGLADELRGSEAVGDVFRTEDDRVVCTVTAPDGQIGATLAATIDLDRVREYDVRPLARADRSPTFGIGEFAPPCAECGNTVDEEGESTALDGQTYYFCCGSCRDNFVARYEELAEGA